jgi:hypothetical protein
MPTDMLSLNTTLIALVVVVGVVLASNIIAALLTIVLRIVIKLKGL